MVDGCVIRELPDGGRQFALEQPELEAIRVDDRVTLKFGPTELAIAGPFTVRTGEERHACDPRTPGGLGPLLARYPGSVRWLWTEADGALHLVFADGARLAVPALSGATTWSVGAGRPGGAA